jgi:SpoVK/Ycf46/Vps4 family AAA+-type ATPase
MSVRLDGKLGVGKCRVPLHIYKKLQTEVEGVAVTEPSPLDVLKLIPKPLESNIKKPASYIALNEYTAKQMHGWVINREDVVRIPLNGRSEYFVVDTLTPYGLVVPSTRVVIDDPDRPNVVTDAVSSRTRGFAAVGGLDKVIKMLVVNVRNPLENQTRYIKAGISPPRGILLYGPPGTGKTLLMKALIDELPDMMIVECNSTELTGPDSDRRIHRVFQDARRRCKEFMNKSVVLFIDELDALCPNRDSSVGEQERRAVAALLTEMDGLQSKDAEAIPIVVIGSTNRPQKIDIALRRPGRFEIEIEIRPPNQADREKILLVISRSRFGNIWSPSCDDIARVASLTHGFVGADLVALISRTALKVLDQGGESIHVEDILRELVHVKPSALREHAVTVPQTHWSDIGGYEEVKSQLIETVIWPTIHSDRFQRMNIEPPRGVLLFGPPGCSKTMMARAIATESRMNFVSVKGPEVFSKWVGDSEQAIRELFRVARQASPCVIFFDEIDALAANRNSEDGGVSGRVLTQLLTEMDGVNSMTQVIVVAATNRPHVLDAALLRPGRLDRLIYVGLPDLEARRSIWSSILLKIPPEARNIGPETIDQLSALTEGYTGAEIVMLAKEAAIQCIRGAIGPGLQEDLAYQFEKSLSLDREHYSESCAMNPSHVLRIIEKTPPRTDNDLVASLISFKNRNSTG